MTPLFDAHNHLHDERLLHSLPELLPAMRDARIEHCIVNGTCQDDWPRVMSLARRYPDLVQPSLGLHPWKIANRSPDWLEKLKRTLALHSGTVFLGECGLDRWIEDPHFEDQREIFTLQLNLAAEHNLPLSIHCLKAWGPLMEILRSSKRPARGFLLHSYGGSAELVPPLASLGARFSFSGYFLQEHKEKIRAAFRQVPPDRLLVETDAPDMLPPDQHQGHLLCDREGQPLNHPANLPRIVNGLARVLGQAESDLRVLLADNFRRFFGLESS
ncbi:MAG: TatD family hydrolase [Roseibacillus sp.]|jgi:TatD DNase family protein|nr:hydrolase TatD [Roseibacillus sp.]MCP4731068.1 TatD family hydrolase [Roseibacillus sp.]MDP7308358.1 TatD family hydrolase [Roseibacillus sp.]HJM63446.1 TatD family hydrolase [Roseibacillus sp.]|tara:strand:+ start:32388 stop:33203 length:816 start_codon:yes stop_codon:yes gene_type:complete